MRRYLQVDKLIPSEKELGEIDNLEGKPRVVVRVAGYKLSVSHRYCPPSAYRHEFQVVHLRRTAVSERRTLLLEQLSRLTGLRIRCETEFNTLQSRAEEDSNNDFWVSTTFFSAGPIRCRIEMVRERLQAELSRLDSLIKVDRSELDALEACVYDETCPHAQRVVRS